jgi:hypothetical protein
MKKIHYFAAWTDSDCLVGCDHEHQTVISAVPCIRSCGGYVVAVENGHLRQLTDQEELEFQHAMYGSETQSARACWIGSPASDLIQ